MTLAEDTFAIVKNSLGLEATRLYLLAEQEHKECEEALRQPEFDGIEGGMDVVTARRGLRAAAAKREAAAALEALASDIQYKGHKRHIPAPLFPGIPGQMLQSTPSETGRFV